MDVYKEFTEWAVARGVELNGIAVHRFASRGFSFIAEKKFKPLTKSFECAEALMILQHGLLIQARELVIWALKHLVAIGKSSLQLPGQIAFIKLDRTWASAASDGAEKRVEYYDDIYN